MPQTVPMEVTLSSRLSRSLSLTAALLLGGSVCVLAVAIEAPPPFYLGGIQVNEPDHEAWFGAVRRSGLNTVSTTVYAHQGDWDSAHMWWAEDEPHVVAEIRGARRRGLQTVLIPRIALDHAFPRNLFLWHGMIMPRDEATLAAWFERYRAFVLKWARVAEAERVDVLAVGSELSALTSTRRLDTLPELETFLLDADKQAERKRALLAFEDVIASRHLYVRGADGFPDLDTLLGAEIEANRRWAAQVAFDADPGALESINRRAAELERHWRDLLADVRRVYGGRLTYAANFDQYRRVGFWDALDMIGINAYFSLRDGEVTGPAGLDAALRHGWREVLEEMQAFRESAGIPGKPFLFTEIGYTYRANSTVQPWAGAGIWLQDSPAGPALFVWQDQPVDRWERARAVRALGETLRDGGYGQMLWGLLYWKLSTVPGHREVEPFVAVLGEHPEEPVVRAMREVADTRAWSWAPRSRRAPEP